MRRAVFVLALLAVAAAAIVALLSLRRSRLDALPPRSALPASQEKKDMKSNSPESPAISPVGRWRSELAPTDPLVLASTDGGLSIRWSPTIDTDIEINGVLAPGAPGEWAGEVNYSAGDTNGTGRITVRLDPSGAALRLTSTFIWAYPVEFTRIATSPAEEAEQAVLGSRAFAKLAAKTPALKLMSDDAAEAAGAFDFRAYTESPDGEVLTVARFRVDAARRELLVFDPVEGEYREAEELGGVGAPDANPSK